MDSLPSQLLILLLLVSSFLVPPTCSTSRGMVHPRVPTGIRIDLVHIDAARNFSKHEIIRRGVQRDLHRLARLNPSTSLAVGNANNEIQAHVHPGSGEFLMDLSIGTPPMHYRAILDTGSDLIWTQCKPCTLCYKQPTPIFDPSKSSTFSKAACTGNLCAALPQSQCQQSSCEYLYAYGDYSTTQGILAHETFGFGSSSNNVLIPNLAFGCGEANQGDGFTQGGGLVGMGRGPLSLVSQLGSSKFSYCLTSMDENKTSLLMIGSSANLNYSNAPVKSTPLIQNPSYPSFFYISLQGITVGSSFLSIPNSTFSLNDDGTGGVIIDSGTTITYLEESGYKLVRKAFVSQMKLPVADGSSTGLDLCFSLDSEDSWAKIAVPRLVFHFTSADLELPPENFMMLDPSSRLLCLAIMESNGMSIFGNIQQQNMHVLYDLANNMLSFSPTSCDQL